jgi:hypothetical protein
MIVACIYRLGYRYYKSRLQGLTTSIAISAGENWCVAENANFHDHVFTP